MAFVYPAREPSRKGTQSRPLSQTLGVAAARGELLRALSHHARLTQTHSPRPPPPTPRPRGDWPIAESRSRPIVSPARDWPIVRLRVPGPNSLMASPDSDSEPGHGTCLGQLRAPGRRHHRSLSRPGGLRLGAGPLAIPGLANSRLRVSLLGANSPARRTQTRSRAGLANSRLRVSLLGANSPARQELE